MDDPMIVQITNSELSEVSTMPEAVETNEEGVVVEKPSRKWNYGSTQTPDDMYLGGLMCE